MQKIAVQTSVPSGGPDTLSLTGTPPGAVQLPTASEIQLLVNSTSGTFTVNVYFWFDGKWIAVGADGTATPPVASCDSTKFGGWSHLRAKGPGFGGYFCAVKASGTGTVGDCFLGAIPNKIA